ncbi:MAG: hypothetical protein FJ030_07050 [Chloroflexi bacterium]|nr:hypothetical protein [Chloroflexota bacterium]
MTKKQLTLFFSTSIVVGLFLTACAGVATGKFDTASSGTLFGAPGVQFLQATSPDFTLTGEVVHTHMAVNKSLETHRLAQTQMQTGHFCHGGAP